MAKSQVPIAKVPINFAGRAGEYTFGIPYGIAKEISARISGDLTPEAAEAIARAYKRGATGAIVMGIGAALKAKGYLKISDDGGKFSLGRWVVPPALAHVPFLEALKMGALLNHGVVKAGWDTVSELAQNVPMLQASEGLSRALSTGGKMTAPAAYAANTARSFVIPGGVSNYARATDQKPKPSTLDVTLRMLGLTDTSKVANRKTASNVPSNGDVGNVTQTMLNTFKEGIPGQRATLPLKAKKNPVLR